MRRTYRPDKQPWHQTTDAQMQKTKLDGHEVNQQFTPPHCLKFHFEYLFKTFHKSFKKFLEIALQRKEIQRRPLRKLTGKFTRTTSENF